MLSVLVATTSFPRWKGDYRGTFIWEGCRALAALGAQVQVVAPHAPGSPMHEAIGDVEIFRPRYLLPERWELLLETPGGLPLLWKRRFGRLSVFPFFFSHALAIARFARGCDLIHSHWILSAFAASLTAPLHRRPIVVSVQGSDGYQAMRMPVFGALGRSALRGARRVIALSGSLAEVAAESGVPRRKIAVIPNGVDTEFFSPNGTPREPVVLCAGSLIQRKGVDTLIEAMALVHRRHPQWRLVVIGEGPRRRELEKLAEQSGLEGAVLFTGSLVPKEVARWMRRSALFALPSREEAQGVAMLEALASGTPCVASRVGGIPEVLDPDWGVLVPPDSPQALGGALRDLIERAGRRRAMGKAAASEVPARYDWSVIAKRILAVYAETLACPELPVGNSGQV
jgi:glycosyltransferase involved in cell wall biosynthesis